MDDVCDACSLFLAAVTDLSGVVWCVVAIVGGYFVGVEYDGGE